MFYLLVLLIRRHDFSSLSKLFFVYNKKFKNMKKTTLSILGLWNNLKSVTFNITLPFSYKLFKHWSQTIEMKTKTCFNLLTFSNEIIFAMYTLDWYLCSSVFCRTYKYTIINDKHRQILYKLAFYKLYNVYKS